MSEQKITVDVSKKETWDIYNHPNLSHNFFVVNKAWVDPHNETRGMWFVVVCTACGETRKVTVT